MDRTSITTRAGAYSAETSLCGKLRNSVPAILGVAAPVLPLILRAEGMVEVLGQFPHAINVVVEDQVIAFVLPSVGEGPFHVVVDALPLARLPHKVHCFWQENVLHLGICLMELGDGARVWNPSVDWERLQPGWGAVATLRFLAEAEAKRRSAWHDGEILPGGAARWRQTPAIDVARAVKRGDPELLCRAALALAGWGPGLTPAGDDVLAGLMLGLRARQGEAVQGLCTKIAALALGRTTRLSCAFLQAAAKGYADARWHALLEALQGEELASIEIAMLGVLSFGSSSGLDMLAGFLWGFSAGTGSEVG